MMTKVENNLFHGSHCYVLSFYRSQFCAKTVFALLAIFTCGVEAMEARKNVFRIDFTNAMT